MSGWPSKADLRLAMRCQAVRVFLRSKVLEGVSLQTVLPGATNTARQRKDPPLRLCTSASGIARPLPEMMYLRTARALHVLLKSRGETGFRVGTTITVSWPDREDS